MPKDNHSILLGFFKSLVSYQRLLEASMWRDMLVEKDSMHEKKKGLTQFIGISKNNISNLSSKLGALTEQEKIFLRQYTKINPDLTHYTNSFDKILESQRLLSTKGLTQSLSEGYRSHSLGDVNALCNDDFIFFRYEVKHDSTKHSRFGQSAIVITGEDSTLFHFGWVSLYEMLNPDTASVLKEIKVDDKVLRTGKIINEYGADVNSIIEYTYPPSGETSKIDLRKYAFFGPDIKLGLGLSIIEQLRLIGGDFQEKYLSSLTTENFSYLTSKLFRAEVKLPRSLYLDSSKFKLEVNPGYVELLAECNKDEPSIDNIIDIIKQYNIDTLQLTPSDYAANGSRLYYLDKVIDCIDKSAISKDKFSDLIGCLNLRVNNEFFNQNIVYNLFNILSKNYDCKKEALEEFLDLFKYCEQEESLAFILVSSIMNDESDDFIKSILIKEIDMELCETDENYPQHVLILAVKKHRPGIIEQLIQRGFDVNFNLCIYTPLVTAVNEGHKDIVELLLQLGADPHVKGQYGGVSAIDAAELSKNPEIVALFKEKGVFAARGC